MRVTIWAGVLILGCPQLVGGPFDGLAFLAVFVVLAAGLLAVGISAGDRTFPSAVLYVVAMTAYRYSIPDVSEHLNAVTPDNVVWQWGVTALYAVLIPGAFFCAPAAMWLWDSAQPEQE